MTDNASDKEQIMAETSAVELAGAVEHLRERLDGCKRGFGDVPQSLTDHAIEIVLGELERLRSALTAAADRLERLAQTRDFTEWHRGDNVGDELRARRRYAVEAEAEVRSALWRPVD